MTIAQLTLSPYQFGEIAFNKGIKAPAMDRDFLETHIKGLQVGEGIAPMNKWLEGWKKSKKDHDVIVEFAAKTFLSKFSTGELKIYNIKTAISDLEMELTLAGCSISISANMYDAIRDKITLIIIEEY